jgi:5-methylcytosine-specific restriction endonuclease McrA
LKTNQKECLKCKKTLPTTLFSKKKSSKDGLENRCKECVSKSKKQNYDKEKIKQTRLRSKTKNVLRFRCNQARLNWKNRSEHPLPDLNLLEEHIKKLIKNGCFYSKKEINEENFGIDHKIPLKRGGTNSLENLVPVDQMINKAKGDMTDKEFISLLKVISKWEDGGESLLLKLRASNTIFKRRF